MFLDSKDFQAIWQLARHWINADPKETDSNALSPELKDVIHRLMLAMACHEISEDAVFLKMIQS